jgi:photosystem II stability/assembly factor-like uncharacterized protein
VIDERTAPVQLATGGGTRLTDGNDVGGVTSPLSAAFVSADDGWVVGEDQVSNSTALNVVEGTTDGGATWTRQFTLGR